MSTKIEWTDETWNPVTGCSKVSQGCKHCYAERLWPKVEGARVKREGGAPRPFTEVNVVPDRLDAPLHWKTPRRVFVNSMSDLFHENVPDLFISQVFDRMGAAPRHVFQILTKRPRRMLEWFRAEAKSGARWPLPNVWIGVSVEDQAAADERIPLLLQAPAAVRWISAEPLLGPINVLDYLTIPGWHVSHRAESGIDWVVAGGESGPGARPMHPDWARSLRDQCAAAGVRFFFKQWGQWAPLGSLEQARAASVPGAMFFPGIDHAFSNVGKKAAGRMLDGRLHDEYPSHRQSDGA